MPPALIPEERLPLGIEKAGVGSDFYEVVNAGKAKTVRGEISEFQEDGVKLSDGTLLPADVVIFATGWNQSVAFLSEELQREIVRDGYSRLYQIGRAHV